MAHILPDPPRTWDYRMASPPPACPHGTAYAQPCYGCGWACPTCGRNYAPWVRECSYAHDDWQKRMGVQPGTFAPFPPQVTATQMVLALPAEVSQPNYRRKFAATATWQEVWPGLQCRSDGPPANGTVFVSFRLTPDGSP